MAALSMRKTVLASCVSAFMLFGAGMSTPASADINKALGGLYDGMSATSPAGVWETQRRGVISGGGLRVRTPIVTESLLNIQTPTLDGGCGGIDMFAGSASFISADQLIALFRNIASNAKAYAFHIALSTVFPEASAKIQDLQEVVQKLNALSMNSCEWAQGIVNAGAGAIENSMGMEFKGKAQSEGVIDGFFDSIASIGDTGNAEEQLIAEGEGEVAGNIVWRGMKDNQVDNWNWLNNATGNAMLESIMSLTGTYIVSPSSDGERENTPLPGPYLSLKDLVEGSESATLLKCNNYTDCDGVTTSTQSLEGLGTMIKNKLNGDASNNGLIYYYSANHASYNASSFDRDFITNLPYSAGSLIRNLAVLNNNAASTFVEEHANALALDMAYELASKMIRAAQNSLHSMDEGYGPEARAIINANFNSLQQEYGVLRGSYGSLNDIMVSYEAFLRNLKANNYHLQDLNPQYGGE
ncbi:MULTISPECIES: conjugal transfer protein TraH [unclassified Halomonas]|uniref:conjugal transfer protein TraH n=1 Tax=unclassified Halomonas TaxID=2609666 RepID=UPI003F9083C3